MDQEILSPLTGKPNTEKIGGVKSEEIISIYRKDYDGMDVSAYFAGIDEIKVMQCGDTHFMFYYPFSTEGDEAYYARMSQFEWYYNPQRWEHNKALTLIEKNEKVLEVGAGAGFFLKRLMDRNITAHGLELNGRAIKAAKEAGVDLVKEYIETYADAHRGEYDLVCSFQVLEHIAQPLSFLKAQVACLKPGGKLIIGVPNNDSYLRDNKMSNKVLNMPPHHVGLWTLASLSALQELLGIKLRGVYYEPLVDGNVDLYLWNKINDLFFDVRIFTRVIWKLKLHRLMTPVLKRFSDRIQGNSMLALFIRE